MLQPFTGDRIIGISWSYSPYIVALLFPKGNSTRLTKIKNKNPPTCFSIQSPKMTPF